jgi:hypothetical protein
LAPGDNAREREGRGAGLAPPGDPAAAASARADADLNPNAPGMNTPLGPNDRPNFMYPATGAMSFLNALKAKDPERLAQTIALHVDTNELSDAKHRKSMVAILNKSLPDNELNALAKSLEGFQVAGTNAPKDSGHLGVMIQKMQGKDLLRRTLMMRKEKGGWKVLDVGREYKIEGYVMPRMGGMRGRRR